jgi:hypothetical protein
MKNIRNINKKALLPLLVMLFVVLLYAQSVTLHVHNFEHDPIQTHHSIGDISGHTHHSDAHFSIDSSHQEHHDGSSVEVDACPDCLINQLSVNVKTFALLSFAFSLLLPLLFRRFFPSLYQEVSTFRRFYLTPPLRAPPH